MVSFFFPFFTCVVGSRVRTFPVRYVRAHVYMYVCVCVYNSRNVRFLERRMMRRSINP